MAQYLANSSASDNAGDGTTTAVKSLALAIAMAGASDSVLATSTKTVPFRRLVTTLAQANTIAGNGTAYVCGSTNITNGATRPDLLEEAQIDGGCDGFVSGDPHAFGWSEIASGATKATSPAVSGNSAQFGDGAATGSGAGQEAVIALPAGESFTLGFSARNNGSAVPANEVRVGVRDSTTTDWWDWVHDTWYFDTHGSNSNGAQADVQLKTATVDDVWDTRSVHFDSKGANNYQLRFQNDDFNALAQAWIDEVTLQFEGLTTFDWTDEGSGVWSLRPLAFTPSRVFITTLSDWSTNGVDGFRGDDGHLYKYTSLVDCQANTWSYFFDTSSGVNKLYVNLGAGVNINDYHIEAAPLATLMTSSAGTTIRDIAGRLSGGRVLDKSSGASITGVNVSAVNSRGGINLGAGGSNLLYSDKANGGEVGYIRPATGETSYTALDVVNNGTVATIKGYRSHHNADDGFQCDGIATGAATMHLEACVADHNTDHGVSYKCKTAGAENANGSIKGLTCYANGGSGLDDSAEASFNGHATANALTIDGFASFGNGVADMAINRADDTGWSIVRSFAATTTTAGADVATGVTTLTAIPFDPATFQPGADSVLLAAGLKWWTGANPVGFDGEPFSDIDTDAGGVQSTNGPFHPVNL